MLTHARRLAVATACLLACGQRQESVDETAAVPPAPGSDAAIAQQHRDALSRLTRWENQQRDATDFGALSPWSEVSGADPFRLRALSDGGTLGLLRGDGSIERSYPDGRPATRTSVFPDATGWASSPDGKHLYVVGQRSGHVARLSLPSEDGDAVEAAGGFDIARAYSLRDVAVGPDGQLAVADAFGHRVLVVDPPSPDRASVKPRFAAPCGGPLAVRYVASHLVALCSLDHAVVAWRLDEDGYPGDTAARIEHDGPMWSIDVVGLPDSGLRVAMGGVEDRPLDRSDGAFGYIDSFVFVTDIPSDGAPTRRAAINVGEHGVVTPKWIRLGRATDADRAPTGPPAEVQAVEVQTVGYGSSPLLTVTWPEDFTEPSVRSTTLVPGITDVVTRADGTVLAASPLLDAWVTQAADGAVTVAPIDKAGDDRTVEQRVGEALLFTGLMAPGARTEGKASRFTCETCHFEGGVDGRVHWTGREDVHASTRSIRGLFANRPHFSRALDGTMAEMVDNEFRVASRGTGVDPWFSLDPAETPWTRHLGLQAPLDGAGLRRALMAFIMIFNHEPNPRALSAVPWRFGEGPSFDDAAELFTRHCESCHRARLVADRPSSHIPRASWAERIRSSSGAIVWATDQRLRTGIEPYVHEAGARVPTLRRLFAKRPYFTDGGAATLREAVDRFSVGTEQHVRDATDGRPLTQAEQQALVRFLELL